MKNPVVVLLLLMAVAGCSDAVTDHNNTGIKLSDDGRWEEAIAEYDEAIRLDLQFALAYNNRGGAYANLGEYQRAIEDFDEAIRLDLQYAVAYSNRGGAYANLGEYQRAMEDHNEARLAAGLGRQDEQ